MEGGRGGRGGRVEERVREGAFCISCSFTKKASGDSKMLSILLTTCNTYWHMLRLKSHTGHTIVTCNILFHSPLFPLGNSGLPVLGYYSRNYCFLPLPLDQGLHRFSTDGAIQVCMQFLQRRKQVANRS